ncbi:hypothetical protein E4U45_008155 [Claviceps purpurea]|nr:hypothetical protein E4U45_008155 [Claviceps purpurea]
MKFSTVLGTFALSTLEANRAYASPVDSVSLSHSLDGRGTEYCCALMETTQGRETKFVPYTGRKVFVGAVSTKRDTCEMWFYQEGSKPPSQGGCAEWKGKTFTCPPELQAKLSVQPASVCQQQ